MGLDKPLIHSVLKSQFAADRMVPGRQKIPFLTHLFSMSYRISFLPSRHCGHGSKIDFQPIYIQWLMRVIFFAVAKTIPGQEASIMGSTTLCVSRWTQRRGASSIHCFQYRRKHRAGLLTGKVRRCHRVVRPSASNDSHPHHWSGRDLYDIRVVQPSSNHQGHRRATRLARNLPWASIVGLAAPDKRPRRAEQLHDPNHQAFDQSGMYSKPSNVADMMIEAQDRCRGLDGEVGIGWEFGHNRRGKTCGRRLWIP